MHYERRPPRWQYFGWGIIRQVLIGRGRCAGRDRIQRYIVAFHCERGKQIARNEVVRASLNDDLIITPRIERRIAGRVQRTADELFHGRHVRDGVL